MHDQLCRIFLVRHGQTRLNREVRFRGIRDVPLDEVGRMEALEAALSLRDSGITKVYSSPLGRAQEVGRRIALATGLNEVEDMPLLLNLDYGEWEGLTKHECAARDPQEWALYADAPGTGRCPGGESVAAPPTESCRRFTCWADATSGRQWPQCRTESCFASPYCEPKGHRRRMAVQSPDRICDGVRGGCDGYPPK